MEGGGRSRSGGEQGVDADTIVVRAVNYEQSGFDDKNRRYFLTEFHKVDLKTGKVKRNCYPKLLIWKGLGKMVLAGRKLYILNCMCEGEDVERASVLNLDAELLEWKHFPLQYPLKDRTYYPCASLNGKLYFYEHRHRLNQEAEAAKAKPPAKARARANKAKGKTCSSLVEEEAPPPPPPARPNKAKGKTCSSLEEEEEEAAPPAPARARARARANKAKGKTCSSLVEEEDDVFWEFMWTPEDVDFMPLIGVVSDPFNKRIIVSMHGGRLYGYNPLEYKMKPICEGIDPWTNVVAVGHGGDIMYVHTPDSNPTLHAFDLSDGGKKMDVVWTSTEVSGRDGNGDRWVVDVFHYRYDNVFHVGNNNFWATVWCPQNENELDYTVLYFIKFQARRGEGNIVICTPLALLISVIPNIRVFDFALLQ